MGVLFIVYNDCEVLNEKRFSRYSFHFIVEFEENEHST